MDVRCPDCRTRVSLAGDRPEACPNCGATIDPDAAREDERARGADRRAPRSRSGLRTVLVVLLGLFGMGTCLCFGGIGACIYLAPRGVTIVDASRTPSPQGGTQSVKARVRVRAAGRGQMWADEFRLVARNGTRQSSTPFTRRQREEVELTVTAQTRELNDLPGPVEVWVERINTDLGPGQGESRRVSDVVTIP